MSLIKKLQTQVMDRRGIPLFWLRLIIPLNLMFIQLCLHVILELNHLATANSDVSSLNIMQLS